MFIDRVYRPKAAYKNFMVLLCGFWIISPKKIFFLTISSVVQKKRPVGMAFANFILSLSTQIILCSLFILLNFW